MPTQARRKLERNALPKLGTPMAAARIVMVDSTTTASVRLQKYDLLQYLGWREEVHGHSFDFHLRSTQSVGQDTTCRATASQPPCVLGFFTFQRL